MKGKETGRGARGPQGPGSKAHTRTPSPWPSVPAQLWGTKCKSVHGNNLASKQAGVRDKRWVLTPSWAEVPTLASALKRWSLANLSYNRRNMRHFHVKIETLAFLKALDSKSHETAVAEANASIYLLQKNGSEFPREKRTEYGESTGFGTRETWVCFFPGGPWPCFLTPLCLRCLKVT